MKRVIQRLTLPMAEHQRENMELRAIHFELSSVLTRSVALYQEMKCIPDCKMAASYVSKLKRQLKQNKLPNNTTNKDHSTLTFEESNHPQLCNLDYPDLLLWSQQIFFPSKYAMKLRCELFRFLTKICKRYALKRGLTNAFH